MLVLVLVLVMVVVLERVVGGGVGLPRRQLRLLRCCQRRAGCEKVVCALRCLGCDRHTAGDRNHVRMHEVVVMVRMRRGRWRRVREVRWPHRRTHHQNRRRAT
jgi:hypothetical protein